MGASNRQNCSDIIFDHADVAQLVEQRIRNAKVDSSIPFIGTKIKGVQQLAERLFYINEMRNWFSYFRNFSIKPRYF